MFTYQYKNGYISIYYNSVVFVANVDTWVEAREEEDDFLQNL